MFKKWEQGRIFMGRIAHGTDLLEELTRFCEKERITSGKIEAIGAVKRASLGFYNQESQKYQFITLDRPFEICELLGNVSLKDDKPFVHAHITLSDREGHVFGGHLAPNTIIFACEFIVYEFQGPPFTRVFDPETGLFLWG